MIQNFDSFLFHAVNSYSGNHFLDSLADTAEYLALLKGGLFMAVFCWLWLESQDGGRGSQRERLVAVLFAGLTAIVTARVLAHLLPFRVRPIYADPLYHPPSVPIRANFENWSSFPSDHAALFFALALGVYLIWRAAGVLLLIYAAIWICLPRLYLGLHYPSDLVAGVLIGLGNAAVFWSLAKTAAFHRWIGRPLLGLEHRYPSIFYACAFLLLFEIANLFADVRYALGNSGFLFHLPPAKIAMLWLALLGMVIMIAGLFWNRAKSNLTLTSGRTGSSGEDIPDRQVVGEAHL